MSVRLIFISYTSGDGPLIPIFRKVDICVSPAPHNSPLLYLMIHEANSLATSPALLDFYCPRGPDFLLDVPSPLETLTPSSRWSFARLTLPRGLTSCLHRWLEEVTPIALCEGKPPHGTL